MPYPEEKKDDSYKLKIGALWTKQNPSGNSKYWSGMTLKPEELEKLIEFAQGPCRLMVLPNFYKTQDRQPDAYVWLYRSDNTFVPKPKPIPPEDAETNRTEYAAEDGLPF